MLCEQPRVSLGFCGQLRLLAFAQPFSISLHTQRVCVCVCVTWVLLNPLGWLVGRATRYSDVCMCGPHTHTRTRPYRLYCLSSVYHGFKRVIYLFFSVSVRAMCDEGRVN